VSYDYDMENETAITLCRSDWERVLRSLRNETSVLERESERSLARGPSEYANLLLEETIYHKALVDYIDFLLPE